MSPQTSSVRPRLKPLLLCRRFDRVAMLLFLGLAACSLSSCAGRRIGQFDKFATAGKTYSEAMTKLTVEAGQIKIDADSELLLTNRDALSPEERSSTYQNQTEGLKDVLAVMGDLRAHTQLLRKYFSALAALSQSDAPSGIGEEAANLVGELQKLSPSLEKATIGNANVKDFIGAVVPIVVAQFQRAALEEQLRKDAPMLERQLELQKAVLAALAEGIEADLESLSNARSLNQVAKPYVQEGDLPKTWREDRRALLSTTLMAASLDDAKDAADTLKKTFVALVENKIGPGDFDQLFADIDAILDVIEMTQSATEE